MAHLEDIIATSITVPMFPLAIKPQAELNPAPYWQVPHLQPEAELVGVPHGAALHVLAHGVCHSVPVIHCPPYCN